MRTGRSEAMLTPAVNLGVGVVGLGVGEQHALAFSNLSTCTLRWVYDIKSSRASEVVYKLGHGAAAPSYEAILSDPDVSIVSLASYDHAHYEQVMAALDARKHVFVEKPLCRSFEEARSIRGAWLKHDSPSLASNLILRVAPLYRWLREAIQGGELGEIYAFDGDYLYGRLHKITEGWRNDVPDYSVMQGGGIHLVDLMLRLTGQIPVSVTAVGNGICTRGTRFRYNDFVSATYRFESGLIGRITANFGCVHRHQHAVRVFGTKATFIYDDAGPRLHRARHPSSKPTPVDREPLAPTKGDLIPPFVRSVLSAQDTKMETEHEFNLICACVAADEAAATRSDMRIRYVR